jgi:hypothetical protein
MFLKTEERPAGEVQQVGRLKLSAAIRIGAKIRPQCRHFFYFEGRSCAMGAAYEGQTGKKAEGIFWIEPFISMWPEAKALFREIARRNDDRGESRESIADWLQSQGL